MTSGSSLPGSADDGSDVQENLDDLINEIGPGIAEDSSDESRQSKGCTGSESGIERARKVTEQATSASAWATLRNLHAACRRYMDVRTTDTIEGKKPSWALGNIKDSVLAPVSNSKKDPNAAWSLRVSILGAKDMPKLDMWGSVLPFRVSFLSSALSAYGLSCAEDFATAMCCTCVTKPMSTG